jgi:TP901 family phage tail tape measure protein
MAVVGVLTALFKFDTKDAERGAKKLKRTLGSELANSLRGMGGAAGVAGKALSGLGSGGVKSMALLAGAVGAGAVGITKLIGVVSSGVRSFASFESSMTRIETLVGVSRKEVDRMSDAVRGISIATGRGPQELAEGLFQITSAGLRGAEAMETLEAAARASAVGLGSVTTIAGVATSAVNAYGSANITAETAVGVLLKTVREGKASPEELAGALGRIIPVAAAMGVEFSEVSGIVASMTRIGLSGSESVNALRGAMLAILSPTEQARKALKEAELSMATVEAVLKEDGLIAALQLLRKNLTTDQLKKFLGRSEALAGVLAITGNRFKETAEIVASTADTMGVVDDAFARTSETAAQKAAIVTQAWQVTKDKIGEAFTDMAFSTLELGDAVGLTSIQTAAATTALAPYVFAWEALGSVLESLGLKETKKNIEELSEAVDASTLSLEFAQEQQAATFARLDKEVESRAKRAAEAAAKLAKEARTLAEIEKTRLTVLAPLVEMQLEFAESAEEAAFQAEALSDALDEFPDDTGFVELPLFLDETVGGLEDIGKAILGSVVPGVGDIEGATKKAKEGADAFSRSIADLSNLFNVLGLDATSSLGSVLSSVSALSSAIQSDKIDVSKIFGDPAEAQKAAQAVIGGIGAIAQATSSGSTKSRAGKGALAGAAAGAQFGLVGAGVGAAAGAITGLLRGRSAEKAMKTIEREVGIRVSEGLLKGIRDSGRPAALFIGDIFAEGIAAGTANVDDLAREMGDVFSALQQGGITEFEAIKSLEEATPLLLQNLRDLGPAGEEQIQRIIGAAQEMGLEFNGLAEIIATTFAPATVETFKSQFGLTNDEIRAMSKLLGIDIQTDLQRLAASVGLTAKEFNELGAALESKVGVPAEQLAEFLEASGLSAAELAQSLGVDVGKGAELLAGAQGRANDRLQEGARLADRLAGSLQAAARASGNIRVPSGGNIQGAQHGEIVTSPALRVVGEGSGAEVIAPVKALLDAAARVAAGGDPELRRAIKDLPAAVQRAVIGGMQRSLT